MTPLDQALENAKQEQSKGDVFYNLFLNTAVFIPTHDAPTSSETSRRSQLGETFQPYVVVNNGIPYLPIFDTYDRLTTWAERHEMAYVQMSAHALIRSSLEPRLHLALNVGTPHTKVFVPEEISWLCEVYESQKPKSFTVPTGTRVLVGAPAKISRGLEDALRQCLKRNDEIEAAYLGQVHFLIEGSKPELFLVLKVEDKGKPFMQIIQEDIGVAVRGFLPEGEHMTLQIYDGTGISSDIVQSVKPFFVGNK